jgi:ATP/ADP translocase
MLLILVAVLFVFFFLLCGYVCYGNYEYRQKKKLLSENQGEHEVNRFSKATHKIICHHSDASKALFLFFFRRMAISNHVKRAKPDQ